MSCKEYWEQQLAGPLATATRVAPGQVDGAERCAHEGCNLPISRATGKCPRGHAPAGQSTQGAPTITASLLCVLEEAGAFSPAFQVERAVARRLAVGDEYEDSTPEMQAAAQVLLDRVEELVAWGGILRTRLDRGHYDEALAALSRAYGDEEMEETDVVAATQEGFLSDDGTVRAAAGPLCYALENLLVRQMLEDEADKASVSRALAQAYGAPELTDAQVLSIAVRAQSAEAERSEELATQRADARTLQVVMAGGAQSPALPLPEEDPVRRLLYEVDELRDAGTNLEGDPRVRAARAYLEAQDRTWWEAPSLEAALKAWPAAPNQLFEEAFYQVTGRSIVVEYDGPPDDPAAEDGPLVVSWSQQQGITDASLELLRVVFPGVPERAWVREEGPNDTQIFGPDGQRARVRVVTPDGTPAVTALLPHPAACWQALQATHRRSGIVRPPDYTQVSTVTRWRGEAFTQLKQAAWGTVKKRYGLHRLPPRSGRVGESAFRVPGLWRSNSGIEASAAEWALRYVLVAGEDPPLAGTSPADQAAWGEQMYARLREVDWGDVRAYFGVDTRLRSGHRPLGESAFRVEGLWQDAAGHTGSAAEWVLRSVLVDGPAGQS